MIKQISPVRRDPSYRTSAVFEAIATGMFPNTLEISTALDEPVSAIRREIRRLREEWEVTLVYDAPLNGYYLASPLAAFPGILTQDDRIEVRDFLEIDRIFRLTEHNKRLKQQRAQAQTKKVDG